MWVVLRVDERLQDAVLGCNLKNDRMDSVCFQGKTVNITVIQACAPTTHAREAEVGQVYEDLQDLLELTPKKRDKKVFLSEQCKEIKEKNSMRKMRSL